MWLGFQADINSGVLCCIWNINPLFIAISDYFIYKVKFKLNHLVGLISFLMTVFFIGFAGSSYPESTLTVNVSISEMIENSLKEDSKPIVLPKWLPVIISLLTPIGFTINAILVKHLTQPRIGFHATTMSLSSYFVVNSIILILALFYWHYNQNFS